MRALTILFLVVAAIALPACASGPDYALESVATAWMPEARSNMAVVEWGDRIWCFGGNGLNGPTATAWEFNPYSHRFRDLPPMAEKRFGHAAVVCGRRILVFGGAQEGRTLDSVEAFDLDRRTWSSAGKMPFTRARFGLAALDGIVYLAGGNDGTRPSAEVYGYDPKSGGWERKADLPEALDRLALVAWQGGLCAIGGETADRQGSTHCWRYDVEKNRWTKMANLSHARRNLCAARLGDRLMVTGGWNIIDDEKSFQGSIETYDEKGRDWVPQGRLETARDGCRAVPWRGRVFFFGGFNGDPVSAVEDCHWRSSHSAWRVDEAMKLQLATWTPTELADGPHVESVKPLNGPAGADITNIKLADIRALGFPLPARDGAMTFYLKLFRYPNALSQEASLRRAAAPWVLSGTAGWDMLTAMIKSPSEVVVKKGYIDATGRAFDAYPPLRVATEERDGVLPQDAFDDTILFSSLYLLPIEKGRTHVDAVAAFEAEEEGLLERSYRPVEGPDRKYTYFLDDTETDQAGVSPRRTVIRIERKPTVFASWKDLPMPQDPQHLFLESLLLLFADDYRVPVAAPKGKTVELVLQGLDPVRSLVFEAGSVKRAP
jgi:N-acetylneuraminic acid mutarotase